MLEKLRFLIKDKKIIFAILIALFFLFLVFSIAKTARERHSSQEEIPRSSETQNETAKDSLENENSSEPEDLGEFLTPEDKEEDEKEEKELKEDEEEPTIKEDFIDISRKDCENNCGKYESNRENLNYCREVCGLTEIQKKSSEDECEDKEELELDYCLRDLGISKKDYTICEKIEDATVSRMCRDRITEEIINGSRAE